MPSATVDDDEVIAALRSGDQAAFAAVTERFRRQLHVHCYRMLGSFDEAEEIVQETFLRAWRGSASVRGTGAAAELALPHRDERLPRRHRASPSATGGRR